MKPQRYKDPWNNVYYRYFVEIADLLADGGINRKTNWKGWEHYLWKSIKKLGRVRKNKQTTISRKVRGITDKFIDILIDELIDNNAVYMLPDGQGCIAIAQRPIKSKRYKYVIEYKQAMPTCYILLSDKAFRSKKRIYKIVLSSRNYQRIESKLKSGFVYMTYEKLVRELNYGIHKKINNDIQ